MIDNQTRWHAPRRRPDEELVAAAKNGQPSAMEELLSRYRDQVYGVVRRHTDNREDAEDLVQEAMLRAFVKLDTFRGDARFSSWLTTIAINLSISMKRKQRTVHWIYLDDPNGTPSIGNAGGVADPCSTPEGTLLQKDSSRSLRRKLMRLRPKYRSVLFERIVNELSIEEIAQALKISPATAKSRLHRAKRILLDGPPHRCSTHRTR